MYIHNLGHATVAYIGYLYNPEFKYIHEALSIMEIYKFVSGTMLESANILITKYPDEFSAEMLIDHINELLYRFQNKALGDTVNRVGCDLSRKLVPEERLAGSIRLATELKQPYRRILFTIVCACRFRAADEEGNIFSGDLRFDNILPIRINYILKNICGFDINKDIDVFLKAEEMYKSIQIDVFKIPNMTNSNCNINILW